MHQSLAAFVARCEAVVAELAAAADRVTAIAPLMRDLAAESDGFLATEHFRSEPDHYARNAIHIAPSGNLSLFALVWLPGQWTPVHDHGSWGVVGIVRGVLEERSYMSATGEITADRDIRLKRGGEIWLSLRRARSMFPARNLSGKPIGLATS